MSSGSTFEVWMGRAAAAAALLFLAWVVVRGMGDGPGRTAPAPVDSTPVDAVPGDAIPSDTDHTDDTPPADSVDETTPPPNAESSSSPRRQVEETGDVRSLKVEVRGPDGPLALCPVELVQPATGPPGGESPSRIKRAARADDDGRVTLTVPEGTFWLVSRAVDFAPSLHRVRDEDLEAGEVVLKVDAGCEVTFSAPALNTGDPADERFEVYDVESGIRLRLSTMDGEGRVQITRLPKGRELAIYTTAGVSVQQPLVASLRLADDDTSRDLGTLEPPPR